MTLPMACNQKDLFSENIGICEDRHPCSAYVAYLCSVAMSHCRILVPRVCQLTDKYILHLTHLLSEHGLCFRLRPQSGRRAMACGWNAQGVLTQGRMMRRLCSFLFEQSFSGAS